MTFGTYITRIYKKGNELRVIEPNINISILKNRRLHSTFADDEYLWICVEKEGVYKCKIEGDELIILDHYFETKSISRVYRDAIGGYWFQSLNEGVFYMPSDKIKYKPTDKNKITSIEVDTITGSLYMAIDNGNILKKYLRKGIDYIDTIYQSSLASNTLHYGYEDKLLLMAAPHMEFDYFQNEKLKTSKNVSNVLSKSFITENNKIYRVIPI